MRSLFLLSFIAVTGMLLSSCGQPVCVMGLGDCSQVAEVKDKGLQKGSNPSGKLRIDAPEGINADPGGKIRVRVTGGQPPYSASLVYGGTVMSDTSRGSIAKDGESSTDLIYTAPATVSETFNIIVRTKDSQESLVEISLKVYSN